MFLTVKGTNTVYFSISIKFLSISMLVQPKTKMTFNVKSRFTCCSRRFKCQFLSEGMAKYIET